MGEIAKIGIYGDLHLYSKNYGAHRDYPKETIEYLTKITELTEQLGITHLIGLGDFSFGRFNLLNYRLQVEQNLIRQYQATNGNHWELQGNHDIVSKDMCERDYYINRGLLKPSENLTVGNVNISMVDYGKTDTTVVNIEDKEGVYNIILAHDFYRFNSVATANYGEYIDLETLEKWFGADILVCGHVHKTMEFDGYITKGDMVHALKVYYPGCCARPSYREGYMDDNGQLICITVKDDGGLDVEKVEFPLWSIAESFNLEPKIQKKKKEEEKQNRVDISDIVKQLDLHDRNVGNPEDIIAGMEGIDEKYKSRAIQLLKMALE